MTANFKIAIEVALESKEQYKISRLLNSNIIKMNRFSWIFETVKNLNFYFSNLPKFWIVIEHKSEKLWSFAKKNVFEEITKMNHVYKPLQQLELLQSSISHFYNNLLNNFDFTEVTTVSQKWCNKMKYLENTLFHSVMDDFLLDWH